ISSPQVSGKRISIPTRLENASGTFLALTDPADDFVIELVDCLSGHSATVTKANVAGLEVYRYDRECLAKLNEFTYGGKVYKPTATDPFTTWQAGDTALFDEDGEPGTNPLQVIVLSTLSDPVSGTDVISYGFSEIATGQAREILWTTVGAS